MFDLQFTNLLMDQKSAAAYLGTTVSSLNAWRSRGIYNIPYVRWGHNIRYRKDDLDKWIAEHTNNNDALATKVVSATNNAHEAID